jgi:hypothetical protein
MEELVVILLVKVQPIALLVGNVSLEAFGVVITRWASGNVTNLTCTL